MNISLPLLQIVKEQERSLRRSPTYDCTIVNPRGKSQLLYMLMEQAQENNHEDVASPNINPALHLRAGSSLLASHSSLLPAKGS